MESIFKDEESGAQERERLPHYSKMKGERLKGYFRSLKIFMKFFMLC